MGISLFRRAASNDDLAGDSPVGLNEDDLRRLIELERKLATSILREGAKLVRRRIARGETLVEQGQPGRDLFVLLDGVFDVEIDGVVVAQVGSGAILGERAVLGEGRRTATLRAVRSSRVAVIGPDAISRPELVEISASHTR